MGCGASAAQSGSVAPLGGRSHSGNRVTALPKAGKGNEVGQLPPLQQQQLPSIRGTLKRALSPNNKTGGGGGGSSAAVGTARASSPPAFSADASASFRRIREARILAETLAAPLQPMSENSEAIKGGGHEHHGHTRFPTINGAFANTFDPSSNGRPEPSLSSQQASSSGHGQHHHHRPAPSSGGGNKESGGPFSFFSASTHGGGGGGGGEGDLGDSGFSNSDYVGGGGGGGGAMSSNGGTVVQRNSGGGGGIGGGGGRGGGGNGAPTSSDHDSANMMQPSPTTRYRQSGIQQPHQAGQVSTTSTTTAYRPQPIPSFATNVSGSTTTTHAAIIAPLSSRRVLPSSSPTSAGGRIMPLPGSNTATSAFSKPVTPPLQQQQQQQQPQQKQPVPVTIERQPSSTKDKTKRKPLVVETQQQSAQQEASIVVVAAAAAPAVAVVERASVQTVTADVVPIQSAESYAKQYHMYSEASQDYRAYKAAWEAEQVRLREEREALRALPAHSHLRSRSIYSPDPELSQLNRSPLSASPMASGVCSPVPGEYGSGGGGGGLLVAGGTALCLLIESSRPTSVCTSPVPGYVLFKSPVEAPMSPSLYALDKDSATNTGNYKGRDKSTTNNNNTQMREHFQQQRQQYIQQQLYQQQQKLQQQQQQQQQHQYHQHQQQYPQPGSPNPLSPPLSQRGHLTYSRTTNFDHPMGMGVVVGGSPPPEVAESSPVLFGVAQPTPNQPNSYPARLASHRSQTSEQRKSRTRTSAAAAAIVNANQTNNSAVSPLQQQRTMASPSASTPNALLASAQREQREQRERQQEAQQQQRDFAPVIHASVPTAAAIAATAISPSSVPHRRNASSSTGNTASIVTATSSTVVAVNPNSKAPGLDWMHLESRLHRLAEESEAESAARTSSESRTPNAASSTTTTAAAATTTNLPPAPIAAPAAQPPQQPPQQQQRKPLMIVAPLAATAASASSPSAASAAAAAAAGGAAGTPSLSSAGSAAAAAASPLAIVHSPDSIFASVPSFPVVATAAALPPVSLVRSVLQTSHQRKSTRNASNSAISVSGNGAPVAALPSSSSPVAADRRSVTREESLE